MKTLAAILLVLPVFAADGLNPAKQIDQSNVGELTVAWIAQLQGAAIKSTPLVVNGVMYLTTPDNVFALDARSGRTIWHYVRESQGDHIGQRGVGMYKDWLYFETPDCHLISPNAKDGAVRWDIELADPKMGYFATMAPLVIKDHVLVGVSGDVTDARSEHRPFLPERAAIVERVLYDRREQGGRMGGARPEFVGAVGAGRDRHEDRGREMDTRNR